MTITAIGWMSIHSERDNLEAPRTASEHEWHMVVMGYQSFYTNRGYYLH